jgi:predicted RND superfamily exporter protein
VVLGWSATHLELNASFEKMIPQGHPYIANYLEYRNDLEGLGNAIRVAVENPRGTIYDADYMDSLRQINDELFVLPEVDRTYMKSLWTPATRWIGVTEQGLEGGPVIPDGYDGSEQSLLKLRANISKSGQIGQLVAFNDRSSIIYVPLLGKYEDGTALNYGKLSDSLEQLRDKYDSPHSRVRIVGFAKVAGDLIAGIKQILLFFAATILVAAAVLYSYVRSLRSTLVVVSCSLVAVLWQLGILPLLGFNLDPYSVLVPFLIFAIGMSHGSQIMNGVILEAAAGRDSYAAARLTFRRLFRTGMAALITDAVGFAVLLVIDIGVIRELAIAASLGVGVLILSNLILLPMLLSYGWSGAAKHFRPQDLDTELTDSRRRAWELLVHFTARDWAGAAVVVAVILALVGITVGGGLKIGDLDPGAPELRADSRYNRDIAYVTENYGASSDVLAVMVKTPDQNCANYDTLMRLDALEWQLRQMPGVDSTNSLPLLARRMLVGLTEGSPKWYDVQRSQSMLNTITASAPRGLYNGFCNLLTLYVYLTDHKAETLSSVVNAVEQFARDNDSGEVHFLLAAGSAGIEAATNIVVEQANRQMLYLVYAVVIVLCLFTFRSWRAVVCAIVPLALTSLLCQALMVALGIGVKVATLPVIALGVGIGVDYALYVMSIILSKLRLGHSLSDAYTESLILSGKIVMLTGVTLAIGVATWIWSPIKFQADMGILLAFMFLWNMLGALVLLPSLAYFLLKPADVEVGREKKGDEPLTAGEAV